MKTDDTYLDGRLVRMDQLLVQPEVHLVWIRKARTLNFELTQEIVDSFIHIWRAYRQTDYQRPAEFLNKYPVTENDALFALFCSASHLIDKGLPFRIDLGPSRMSWTLIDATEPERCQ